MKRIVLLSFILCNGVAQAQELYIFTEPASNMPANAIGIKTTAQFAPSSFRPGAYAQRYTQELQFGLSAKWMLHTGFSFSNMRPGQLGWESAYVYGKYRFFTRDAMHRHFRLAAFADLAYSRNPFMFDEVSLKGDKSGAELGLIATQLWHKFALSGTVSHTQLFHESRGKSSDPVKNYQSLNYSLSAGYLLLPREYTDYQQLNLNLYLELLGQQTIDRRRFYHDLAPSLQFIFAGSRAKLNLSHRFQLNGNQERMAKESWMIGLEYLIFGALN